MMHNNMHTLLNSPVKYMFIINYNLVHMHLLKVVCKCNKYVHSKHNETHCI